MNVYNSILDTVGNTPAVKLNRILPKHVKGEIYAKLEFFNPGGSSKDRIGINILLEAERRGDIKPGGTIVECTSGNTGFGLALTAAVKGYRCVFIMPDKMSKEKINALRAFGARVIVCPTNVEPTDPRSYYSVARRIAETTPNSFFVNQYDNIDNRETHVKTTGPEIYKQFDNGKFDAFVAGMGTCGTITGVAYHLKKVAPHIKIVGVDPVGSILRSIFLTGKPVEAKPYKIEGIGEDIVPKNLDFKAIDEIIEVADKESYVMTGRLLKEEGIFVGSSSGAAVVGAIRWLEQNPGKKVVVLLPDSGNRYLSKTFDEMWLRENHLLDEVSDGTVSELLAVAHQNEILSFGAGDEMSKVAKALSDQAFSQAPILADKSKGLTSKNILGVIKERDLMSVMMEGKYGIHDPVGPLVKDTPTFFDINDPVSAVAEEVRNQRYAMILENDRLVGIITSIDVLNYYSSKGQG